jgi:hypothetical protein
LPLKAPPSGYPATNLKPRYITAERLIRVSLHDRGEPHFGKGAANRFDDPKRRFGTCYFGLTLGVAFAETVLHDEVAVDGVFHIAPEEFERRHVVEFDGDELALANLTGAALKRLGADGSLSSCDSYDLPRQWSAWIHGHPAKVDGFVYMSRHYNTRQAVVLFDRARNKLHARRYTPLRYYPGIWNVKRALGVCVDYI